MGADARRQVGVNGEDAVAAWYRAAGYTVLDRNWRVREGELDVVVANRQYVVFCEVKTRRSDRFGTPAEAVTFKKQQRLRRLALHWLDQHEGTAGRAIRFDVASVGPDGRGSWQVSVIEHAF